ncbi:MAG: hypothetical protein J5707_02745 [Candidatus Methanomethylophilus sp.]|nr:hypothetical protein [Methanomethylophilus sp.]
MGFLSRLRGKKEEQPAEQAPAEPLPTYEVIFRCPTYFKMGDGEYHLIIDGVENVVPALKTFTTQLSVGKHTLRVFSAPETLDDATVEFEVADRYKIISISVNAKTRRLKIFDEETQEILYT